MASEEKMKSEAGCVSKEGSKGMLPFFLVAGVFSLVVNVLMLVTPLYMLQIYDRVLISGSMDTLIWVSVAAVGMLFSYGFAEAARRKVMTLAAQFIQERYGPAIMRSGFNQPSGSRSLPAQLNDLAAVQSLHQNGLSLPLFDLPFTPLFLIAMFLVHPLVGWLGVIGGIILVLTTALTEFGSRGSVEEAKKAERSAQQFAEDISRNRNAVVGMGIADPLLEQWSEKKRLAERLTARSASLSRVSGSHARGFRLMLQVGALGIGAWLVLQQQVTAGAIVAGSILMGRALAPIDQCLGGWRHFVRSRQAWKTLRQAFQHPEAHSKTVTALPRPDATLSIEGLKVSTPGAESPLLPKFSMNVSGGSVVVFLGMSGTGKSSLLNTISGAWMPYDGVVRLGGRDVHRWADNDRGRYIGYLPQDVELLPGSVAENVSRFSNADSDETVSCAQRAGFHDLIVHLPDGYDTQIGGGGHRLSRGQSQAIGLTRAFFGDPVLLCLDEPSSNIDQKLFSGLSRAIVSSRENGAIVLISTHDLRLVEIADHVVLLGNGTVQMVSAKDYLATLRGTATLSQKAGGLA